MGAANEDNKDDPDVESGNMVFGAVAASVAIESKLLHLVMIHNRNSLWRCTFYIYKEFKGL